MLTYIIQYYLLFVKTITNFFGKHQKKQSRKGTVKISGLLKYGECQYKGIGNIRKLLIQGGLLI